MIRIMLVDDQRFARLGFQLMLDDASDIVVTAQSADGRSAIETLEQLAVQHRPLPNVILMDVRMPGMDGIEATRRITRRWPTISILILTTYDEDDYAFGGLDAGASGFLLKDVTKHNLIDAVHAIANGDAILTPRITRQVLERGVPHPHQQPAPARNAQSFRRTHPRQREICALISEGLINEEIANQLTVEPASVKRAVTRILATLGRAIALKSPSAGSKQACRPAICSAAHSSGLLLRMRLPHALPRRIPCSTPHSARWAWRILVMVATPVCFAALDGGLGLVRSYHAVLMSSSIFSDGFL